MDDFEYDEITWSESDFMGPWDNIEYDKSLWIPEQHFMDTLSFIAALPEKK